MKNFCNGLVVAFLAVGVLTGAEDANFAVDFESRGQGCPATVDKQTKFTMHITGINNIAFDPLRGTTADYEVLYRKFTNFYPGDSLPLITQAAKSFDCQAALEALRTSVDKLKAELAVDSDINPNARNPPRVPPLAVSANALQKYATRLAKAKSDYDTLITSCPDAAGLKNEAFYLWLVKASGDHSFDWKVTIDPDADYDFQILEKWPGARTNVFRWHCGDSDKYSLSMGALFTWTPYRTYDHAKAPVPPGGSTTADVLSVSGDGTPKPLATGLVNVRIPVPGKVSNSLGLMFSSGPAFTLGSAPKVSSFGWFAGVSVHLYGAVYLTPGVHIGEFADFPSGFYPYANIPANFGELTPVKRPTTHFAIGLTYRVKSFGKSAGGGSTPPAPKAEAKAEKAPGTTGNEASGNTPAKDK